MDKAPEAPAKPKGIELTEEDKKAVSRLREEAEKGENSFAINLKKAIPRANSAEDVYRILKGFEERGEKFLAENGREYDPTEMISGVKLFWESEGEENENLVTRSFGLRDRVKELKQIETTRNDLLSKMK